MERLLEILGKSRILDLSQPYYVGMPHHPTHPPFLFGLVKQHGDFVSPEGTSSAADAIALGTHAGTHIDALCHFSCGGKLHGGENAEEHQSYAGGLRRNSIDTVTPILRRAVMLDIAGRESTAALPVDFEITPAHLDDAVRAHGVEIRAGDVVLLRTGWGSKWKDAANFIAQVHGPGPSIDGARWLSSHRVFAAGSDTVAFEKVPAPDMPVHVHLLVRSGIHIIECLNLEELAQEDIHTFLLVGVPLKLTGATASPIRPLAVVP